MSNSSAKRILNKMGVVNPDGTINMDKLKDPRSWIGSQTGAGGWKVELRARKWCGPKTYYTILKMVGETVPEDDAIAAETASVHQRASDVGLMLWSMKKIGCIDRIKRAYKVALEACSG